MVFPHTYRSYENVEPGKDLHPGPYGRGKAGLELYDLANDIGERVDLAQTYPDVVMDLEILGEKARSILGDKLTDRIGVESYDAVCGFDPPVEILENSAVGKSILMENYANKKYPGESKDALINGLGASINYRDPSWQGFEAEDLIATIDLGSITKINSVNVRFLQDQVVWIFLPKKVEIEHSLDGDNFDMLYESYQDNDFSFDQNIYNYLVEPKGIESRYIRIKGYNLDQCPDYHPGAGRPCWLFTDEIIIN